LRASSVSLASILATPCANTGLTPAAGNLRLVRAAPLCLINQERARHNEQPLRLDAALERAAQGHSEEMIARDYFAHVSPSGETPLQRVVADGYLGNRHAAYVVGENLAWGTLSLATPRSIVAAWVASPPHLANILEAACRETGIGVVPEAPPSLAEGQAGALYAQEFGVIG
jgi:uncharacterized protein YkwD